MIGGVIKDRPRGSYVIATKVTGPEDRKTGFFTKEATSKLFLDKFETSLKRLGLDYVDILYMHSVVNRESILYEPFLSTMVKLKKAGRVRFIGVSTHGNEAEVIRTAARSGIYDVVLTAYNFRQPQPHLSDIEAAMEEANRADVGIVAMKTQAGVYWDRERQNQINMKAALKWTLLNKNVHTTIPGIATFEQLETDLSILEDPELTPDEKKDLQLGSRLGLPGLYCRQCGTCVKQCRRELDIPTYMRSFMYTYGYRDLALAVEAMSAVDVPESPCGGCVTCSVTCTMGFDIKSRVTDIARIRNIPDDFVV
jgi:predicted aldo/keto reductase-like oxidoreductase